jgi:hypothetical protein
MQMEYAVAKAEVFASQGRVEEWGHLFLQTQPFLKA